MILRVPVCKHVSLEIVDVGPQLHRIEVVNIVILGDQEEVAGGVSYCDICAHLLLVYVLLHSKYMRYRSACKRA